MDTRDTISARITDLMRAHKNAGGFGTPEGIQAYNEGRKALIVAGGWEPDAFEAALEARLQELKSQIDPAVRARIEERIRRRDA